MSPTTLAYIGTDLAALALLVGALYLPRHGRRDLTAAYIGVNIGVLAVTLLLSTASVGAGLGLGLFGVLSIIRLRSTEISQGEIAYFFASLAKNFYNESKLLGIEKIPYYRERSTPWSLTGKSEVERWAFL